MNCKLCFKEISDVSFYCLTHRTCVVCEKCFSKFNAKFISFKFHGYKCLAIYEYDSFIRELIYKYKGCYDYELKNVFLSRYLTYLRIKYHGYYVIPIPSHDLDDQRRGFNHVVSIFEGLNLRMMKIIKKRIQKKQATSSKGTRIDVDNVFSIDTNAKLKDKKVLVVDDVFTTGATLYKCLELVKQLKPKEIKVLLVAETPKKRKNEY